MTESWHGTTILSVRRGNQVVIAGDGQVSLQNMVLKPSATKVRRVGKGDIIAGFAWLKVHGNRTPDGMPFLPIKPFSRSIPMLRQLVGDQRPVLPSRRAR